MTPKKITRTILYSFWALSNVFLVGTKGFKAATWNSLDWFEILTLALVMNSNLLLVIIAYLDNSSADTSKQQFPPV